MMGAVVADGDSHMEEQTAERLHFLRLVKPHQGVAEPARTMSCFDIVVPVLSP